MTTAERIAQAHATVVALQVQDPEFDLAAQIRLCREYIRQWQDRLWALEKHLESPRVLVVLHYKRYHADQTSDISEGQTLEQAYHQLWHICYDNGNGYPVGVSVGGRMVTWDELIDEFGAYDPW